MNENTHLTFDGTFSITKNSADTERSLREVKRLFGSNDDYGFYWDLMRTGGFNMQILANIQKICCSGGVLRKDTGLTVYHKRQLCDLFAIFKFIFYFLFRSILYAVISIILILFIGYFTQTLSDEVFWRGLTVAVFIISSGLFLLVSSLGLLAIFPCFRKDKPKRLFVLLLSLFSSLALAMPAVIIAIHILGFRYFGWD